MKEYSNCMKCKEIEERVDLTEVNINGNHLEVCNKCLKTCEVLTE